MQSNVDKPAPTYGSRAVSALSYVGQVWSTFGLVVCVIFCAVWVAVWSYFYKSLWKKRELTAQVTSCEVGMCNINYTLDNKSQSTTMPNGNWNPGQRITIYIDPAYPDQVTTANSFIASKFGAFVMVLVIPIVLIMAAYMGYKIAHHSKDLGAVVGAQTILSSVL